jgi:hypothetical protein
MVHVDAVAVGDDRDVVRVGGVLTGKDALRDLEVVQPALETADSVKPLDDARPGALDDWQAENPEASDRDVV